MTGLDTNVLVRYLAQDDVRQSALAGKVIEAFTAREPGFVSVVTLVETIWVLQDGYAKGREQVAAVIESLLHTEGLVVQMAGLVWQCLRGFKSGHADFADHLIERLSAAEGCVVTLTFDKAAARDGGMRLLGASSA